MSNEHLNLEGFATKRKEEFKRGFDVYLGLLSEVIIGILPHWRTCALGSSGVSSERGHRAVNRPHWQVVRTQLAKQAPTCIKPGALTL